MKLINDIFDYTSICNEWVNGLALSYSGQVYCQELYESVREFNPDLPPATLGLGLSLQNEEDFTFDPYLLRVLQHTPESVTELERTQDDSGHYADLRLLVTILAMRTD